jgi:sec-independent protein translocase protein TatA
LDFLNVGPWELVLVLIIAILVAGPKRMVEISRTLGRVSRQLRDLSREFTTALQAEIQATEAEATRTGADLREVRKGLEEALSSTPATQSEPSDDEEAPVSPPAQAEIQEGEAASPAGAGEGEDALTQSPPGEAPSVESRDDE